MSLLDKIKEHEGFRSSVYQCTQGVDTIGYGFAIKDLELTKEIAEQILIKKIANLESKVRKKFEWYMYLPQEGKDVIVNLCYQLGINGFSKFKKTIYLLETEQYEEASVEMLDSLWAKQTPRRAKELSEVLRSL
jgi:lysozyme